MIYRDFHKSRKVVDSPNLIVFRFKIDNSPYLESAFFISVLSKTFLELFCQLRAL